MWFGFVLFQERKIKQEAERKLQIEREQLFKSRQDKRPKDLEIMVEYFAAICQMLENPSNSSSGSNRQRGRGGRDRNNREGLQAMGRLSDEDVLTVMSHVYTMMVEERSEPLKRPVHSSQVSGLNMYIYYVTS